MKKEVRSIPREQAVGWILEKHYAHRIPSISWVFGLYLDDVLSGIVSYGTPSSSSLREGVCGKKHIEKVIELNRLVLNDGLPKNSTSYLVSQSLKQLPKPKIVVSYADTGQGHVGYIYQATNFIYTGLSAKRTDWKIKGMEGLHGQTIADMSRGKENRAGYMRERFGDDFFLEERDRKHRYIYFVGCPELRKELLYKEEPYPKGESKRYDSGKELATQALLF